MNIILACDQNFGIGHNDEKYKLPWHIKEDLQRFKCVTAHPNSILIMGKNTFLSLKKPLPNRMNFVVSSSLTKEHSFYNGFHFFNTFEFAYQYAKNLINIFQPNGEIWVIGGAQLYDYVISNYKINKFYLTFIYYKYNCNVYLYQNTIEFIKNIQWNSCEITKSKNVSLTFYIYDKSKNIIINNNIKI
tara:strand:- start:609 stop:1172 length:564 start_codon:yes stop_codon:yes gene_type:complete